MQPDLVCPATLTRFHCRWGETDTTSPVDPRHPLPQLCWRRGEYLWGRLPRVVTALQPWAIDFRPAGASIWLRKNFESVPVLHSAKRVEGSIRVHPSFARRLRRTGPWLKFCAICGKNYGDESVFRKMRFKFSRLEYHPELRRENDIIHFADDCFAGDRTVYFIGQTGRTGKIGCSGFWSQCPDFRPVHDQCSKSD